MCLRLIIIKIVFRMYYAFLWVQSTFGFKMMKIFVLHSATLILYVHVPLYRIEGYLLFLHLYDTKFIERGLVVH
jgi:hypothetical protein